MKVLVRDYSSFGIQQTIALGGTYAEARENFAKKSESMKARYDKFKEYESFAGVLAYDEPDSTLFPAIAAAQDWFLKYYPSTNFTSTCFPTMRRRNSSSVWTATRATHMPITSPCSWMR